MPKIRFVGGETLEKFRVVLAPCWYPFLVSLPSSREMLNVPFVNFVIPTCSMFVLVETDERRFVNFDRLTVAIIGVGHVTKQSEHGVKVFSLGLVSQSAMSTVSVASAEQIGPRLVVGHKKLTRVNSRESFGHRRTFAHQRG